MPKSVSSNLHVKAWSRYLLATALAAALARPGNSQTSFGAIVGAVTDPSGAQVPDATVTVTNLGTSGRQTGSTNTSGAYEFVNLNPGTYRVDIEKSGFKRLMRDQIEVRVSALTWLLRSARWGRPCR
jgi:hypothetical protein